MKRSTVLHLLTGTLITASVFITTVVFSDKIEPFDNRIHDLFYDIRGPLKPKGDVVIVDIDEKSLASVGQWPWPRNKIAAMVESLTKAEAGVIGLDVIFSEPDNASPKKVLQELGLSIAGVPDNDEILAKTIGNSPVILGYMFDMEGVYKKAHTPLPLPLISVEKNRAEFDPLFHPKAQIQNLAIIQNAAYSSGYFNMIPDPSGIVRSVPMVMRYHDTIYPALSLEMVRAALGAKKLELFYDENGLEQIKVGELFIPTDGFGRFSVNYRGKGKTFPYVSAVDIMQGKFDPALIKGKFVLVGTSASGLLDLRATPLDNVYPGVEVHANVIDNILNGDFWLQPSWVLGVNALAVVALGIGAMLSVIFLSSVAGFGVIMLLGGGFLAAQYYVMLSMGLITATLAPLFALIMVYLVGTVGNYYYESRQKEMIKAKFAKKVSPQVAEDLIKRGGEQILEGTEKEISIFFSDIRGFTTLSEAMGSPKALIGLLNEYMTPMVDIIVAHQGTVDKFIGDAIMAYWNAPNNVANHPDEAVSGAVEQISALKALNVRLTQEGKPNIDIGIGINTGICTIGEMGSSGRADYTIIGDPVNLASRLEGLTKTYGAHIVISEFTKEKLTKEYTIRELDLVKVKGKTEPVRIFQVMNIGLPDTQTAQKIERYHSALNDYYESRFSQALEKLRVLENEEHDKLYLLYIDRCEHFVAEPPVNFDGVFTFTTK